MTNMLYSNAARGRMGYLARPEYLEKSVFRCTTNILQRFYCFFVDPSE